MGDSVQPLLLQRYDYEIVSLLVGKMLLKIEYGISDLNWRRVASESILAPQMDNGQASSKRTFRLSRSYNFKSSFFGRRRPSGLCECFDADIYYTLSYPKPISVVGRQNSSIFQLLLQVCLHRAKL